MFQTISKHWIARHEIRKNFRCFVYYVISCERFVCLIHFIFVYFWEDENQGVSFSSFYTWKIILSYHGQNDWITLQHLCLCSLLSFIIKLRIPFSPLVLTYDLMLLWGGITSHYHHLIFTCLPLIIVSGLEFNGTRLYLKNVFWCFCHSRVNEIFDFSLRTFDVFSLAFFSLWIHTTKFHLKN